MRGPRFSAAGLWVAAIACVGAGRCRDDRRDCGDAESRFNGPQLASGGKLSVLPGGRRYERACLNCGVRVGRAVAKGAV
jgi:hypothetical protein